MTTRKAISKKRRFDVFKRDGFICQYCGSHPPAAILHVDHIIPVKEGGGNEETNLVTSCDTCNLGKAANSLDLVPMSLADRADQVREREAQLRGYSQVMQAHRDRLYLDTWDVADIFIDRFKLDSIRKDWFQSMRGFVEKLGVHECIVSMQIATAKIELRAEPCFRYFCGICWKKIREAA